MAEQGLAGFQDHLNRVRSFLDRDRMLSVSQDEQNRLKVRAAEIEQLLQTIREEHLLVGLLGGTGVGKSTLLNALAGESIASADHRRPHTDRILVYRHQASPSPDFMNTYRLPFSEVTHAATKLKQVILCDFPDFDSIVEEHQKTAAALLQTLDLPVLVSSPEKYADRAMYAFLESIPQSRSNLYYVLNKIDRIAPLEIKAGQNALQEMTNHFKSLLSEACPSILERQSPGIYLLSALEAVQGSEISAWNQFEHFREHLFQRRSLKQVSRIKTDNLQSELRHLLGLLQQERRQLQKTHQTLNEIVGELEQNPEIRFRNLPTILGPWLQQEMPARFRDGVESVPLYGPGRLIRKIMQEWRLVRAGGQPEGSLELPAGIVSTLQARLDEVQNRIKARLLQQGVPETIRSRVDAAMHGQNRVQAVASRWILLIQNGLRAPFTSSFFLFRLQQRLVYWLMTLFLILVLFGSGTWSAVIRNPHPAALFDQLTAGLKYLFSGNGLAALLAYGLLMLFTGLRFYQSVEQKAERIRQERIRTLFEELGRDWDHEWDEMLAGIKAVGRDLEHQAQQLDQNPHT